MIRITKFLIYAFIGFAVFGIALMLFLVRPSIVAGVDGGALAYSVEKGPYGRECRKGPGDDWTCLVEGDRSSARYRVDVRWDGCWQAERVSGRVTDYTPQKLSGCISVIDHLQLQRIFD